MLLFTEDDLKEELWNMGMRLRNRLSTWVDHPSYDSKSNIANARERLVGAHYFVQFLGIPNQWRDEFVNLNNHLEQPGSDRKYREEAYRLALLAYPLKES